MGSRPNWRYRPAAAITRVGAIGCWAQSAREAVILSVTRSTRQVIGAAAAAARVQVPVRKSGENPFRATSLPGVRMAAINEAWHGLGQGMLTIGACVLTGL